MNAVVAPQPELFLLLCGKELRRDLTIRFDPECELHFSAALYPKGKGQYFQRGPFLVHASGKDIDFRMSHSVCVGHTFFEVTDSEKTRIESWLAALPNFGESL